MIHVCVVDDDALLLAGMQRVMRRAAPDVRLTLCTSGAEALTILQTQHVDVLISDLRMPGMDGHTLMAAVQRQFPLVARVIMTGDLDPQQAFALQLVAHRIVAKPIDGSTISSIVQELGAAEETTAAARTVPWVEAAATRLAEQRARNITAEVARNNPWLAMLLLQAANGGFVPGAKPTHVDAAVRCLGSAHLSIIAERLRTLGAAAPATCGAITGDRTPSLGVLLTVARENAETRAPFFVARLGASDLSVADFVAIAESAVLLRAAAPATITGAWADRDVVLRTASDAARMGVPLAVVQAVRDSVNEPLCERLSVGAIVQSAFDQCLHGSLR